MVCFKPSPADFVVEEIVRLAAASGGDYTVYRLQKRGITTLQAQVRLAAALGVPHSAVAFPALKDKQARATQYGTVYGTGPACITGPGFRAERVGMRNRPFSPRDLLGNRFTVLLPEMSAKQARDISLRLDKLGRYGFPNYFDQQRFGSYAPGHDMVGKRILLRDAEGALRAHLALPFVGDPPRVRAFKHEAQQHWGEWRYLLEQAPKPSNFRSVLTFLVDHPQDYRKALNLVTPRLLSLYLAAYQSLLWNRLAARYLQDQLQDYAAWPVGKVRVAGESLPFYRELPAVLLRQLRAVSVPLFHHRLVISDQKLADLSRAVLAEEALEYRDFKARLLKRAYLARGFRSLLVFPRQLRVDDISQNDTAPHRCKLRLSFVLPPGSYATLMLKLLLWEE